MPRRGSMIIPRIYKPDFELQQEELRKPDFELQQEELRNRTINYIASLNIKRTPLAMQLIGPAGTGKSNFASYLFEQIFENGYEGKIRKDNYPFYLPPYDVVRYLRDPSYDDIVDAMTQGEPGKKHYFIVIDDVSYHIDMSVYLKIARYYVNIRHNLAKSAKVDADDIRACVIFAHHEIKSLPPLMRECYVNFLCGISNLVDRDRLVDIFYYKALDEYFIEYFNYMAGSEAILEHKKYNIILCSIAEDNIINTYPKAKGNLFKHSFGEANEDKDYKHTVARRYMLITLNTLGIISDEELLALDKRAMLDKALCEEYIKEMAKLNIKLRDMYEKR